MDNKISIVLDSSENSNDSIQLISEDSHDNNGNPSDTSKIQQTIPTNSLGTSSAIVAKNDLTSSDKSDDSIVAVSDTKIGCEVAPIKYIAVKPMIAKKSAETNMFHEDDEDDMWKNLPSTQQLVKTAITPKSPREQLMKTVIKKEPKLQEHLNDVDDNFCYNIPLTQELFNHPPTKKLT